jgi:hypothetical protein
MPTRRRSSSAAGRLPTATAGRSSDNRIGGCVKHSAGGRRCNRRGAGCGGGGRHRRHVLRKAGGGRSASGRGALHGCLRHPHGARGARPATGRRWLLRVRPQRLLPERPITRRREHRGADAGGGPGATVCDAETEDGGPHPRRAERRLEGVAGLPAQRRRGRGRACRGGRLLHGRPAQPAHGWPLPGRGRGGRQLSRRQSGHSRGGQPAPGGGARDRGAIHRACRQRRVDGSRADGAADPGAGRCPRPPYGRALRGRPPRLDAD